MPQNSRDLEDRDRDKVKVAKIKGPFWLAEADIIQLADPRENGAYRSLFVDNTPRRVGDDKNVLFPGALLALCFVRSVQIRPTGSSQPSYTWKRAPGDKPKKIAGAFTAQEIKPLLDSGQLSLLLVQADPEEWEPPAGKSFPQLTCLAGEINLDVLSAEENARGRLYRALTLTPADPGGRAGAARLLGSVLAHGSGLTVFGKIVLPWRSSPISAPFQLARLVPDPPIPSPQDRRPGFRLTVEAERLTETEEADIVRAWRDLSRYVNPKHPLNGLGEMAPESPAWVTLEIADPLRLPRLYWHIAPWREQPARLPLHFERDEISLLISDQEVYDTENPPTSLARAVLEDVVVTRDQNELSVTVSLGPDTAATGEKLAYTGTPGVDSAWEERWSLAHANVAFNAVETPRFLRDTQDLPVPEWSPGEAAEPIETPVLWGFMPLADGWAQLPVPNLTEQIYLDADLVQSDEADPEVLLQGAVSFGNDKPGVLASQPDEQPWSLTLTNAGSIKGQWRLTLDPATGLGRLVSVTLELHSPELTINGVLWFSTKRPTEADALPGLDDWVGALRAIPLSTVQPGSEPFPGVVTTPIEVLTLELRRTVAFPSALLGTWSFVYQADTETLRKMVEKKVLPRDTFGRFLPLVWRRHAALPMIQALPLTQNKLPPNHPSASRQLVPFELATAAAAGDGTIAVPENWRFGVSGAGGAADWPSLRGDDPSPAREWRSLFDLPLAALSIPGLVFDPRATGLDPDTAAFLPLQYRFDLPYTDELNALAQLPKVPQGLEGVLPTSGSPPETVRPLTRETFDKHWRRLAERASLASADAVATFFAGAEQTLIRHLIEPFVWPVRSGLDLEQYPGVLTISNAADNQPAPLTLQAEEALRGIAGDFVEDDGMIRRLAADENVGLQAYAVEAGTMAAHRDENGAFRDQRGLHRSATAGSARLLKTPVRLHEASAAYELTSAFAPFPLHISFDAQFSRELTWNFWFRDLPIRTGIFDRAQVRSDRAQDVNDPEAASRELNHLTGYEWRLELEPTGYLPLLGLRFYPLTLEKVVVDGDQLERVEIIGRLQLPLDPNGDEETEEVSNAVRVTFEHEADLDRTTLTAVTLASEIGEWLLAPLSGDGTTEVPRLRWKKISLDSARGAIEIEDVELGFYLFDAEWRMPLDKLTFDGQATTIEHAYRAQPTDALEPLTPAEIMLRIDLQSMVHEVSVLLAVRLGKHVEATATQPRPLRWQQGNTAPATPPRTSASTERSTFGAAVRFHILGPSATYVGCESATLFDDMVLPCEEDTGAGGIVEVSYTHKALQFTWQRYEGSEETTKVETNLQLLPGMHLSSQDVPGFAALSFSVLANDDDGVPKLQLETSFVETMLFCRWGDSLQAGQVPSGNRLSAVFGSSSGDIVFGYTARSKGNAWEEALLLNGVLEVKNLISWPLQMAYDAAKTTITLPAARGAGQRLDHTRHTIRVLFNQHQVPADILVLGKGELLFDLARDKSWQFLAVVEHQLVDVLPGANLGALVLQQERRWTVVQEVRLLSPANLKRFLDAQRTKQVRTTDPEDGTDLIGETLYGYLGTGLRSRLTEGTNPELDRLPAGALLVEASALHWVKQTPVPATSMTALQFLPQGSQLAMLSDPQDYAPSDPHDPRWLLLTTPFLGRLQDKAYDRLEQQAPNAGDPSALQVDPVLLLHRKHATMPSAPLPDLALALATWGDAASVTIDVSGFDAAIGRTWARLDPLSLSENWFRLQHPVPEAPPSHLQSVLASLTDTPARLSRPIALRRAWDAQIRSYPPTEDSQRPTSQPVPSGGDLVWHEHSLLAPQGISSRSSTASPPYGWYLSALQIITSALSRRDPSSAGTLRRYVAATALPTSPQHDTMPLGFAVSPYLALEMRLAGEAPKVRLVFAELLCLNAASETLLPVASHVWEAQAGEDTHQAIRDASIVWARESHLRLSPESPIALLRYREINEDTLTDTGTPLTTSYAFTNVSDIRQPQRPAKRVFRLRSAVQQLRFREGQFGGGQLPAHVQPFELAPPQTTALQPLYLTERPPATTTGRWPWGLSAVRVGVRYTQGEAAVIGRSGGGSANGSAGAPPMLWWQALRHAVQYRAAIQSEGPTAGLPPHFRTAAIKSLLPVLPDPPLPVLDPGVALQLWQPVLPGVLRYMLVGARSGVMLAMRHALLSQRLPAPGEDASQSGTVMVSGSVPVQHRVPRPLPLPANRPEAQDTALQTWASFFESARDHLATASPVDEAFFAVCGDDPARGLRMKLEHPPRGEITSRWDGDLTFDVLRFEEGTTEPGDWEVSLELTDTEIVFEYEMDTASPYRFLPQDVVALKEHLAGKNAGETMLVHARVKPARDAGASGNGCFHQTLSFVLRVGDENGPPLPLKPYFVHFEDPGYNRRLSSSSARASVVVKTTGDSQPEMHTVTLATDRREYNPDGRLAIRYDWDTEPENYAAKLRLRSIDANGVIRDLVPARQDSCSQIEPFTPGTLLQLSLIDLRSTNTGERVILRPGQTLQLELLVEPQGGEPTTVALALGIVAAPVTPVPESAYALLRRQVRSGKEQVECIQFAWSPEPDRVELVCPTDLQTEVVRRRAVFHWNDSARPGTSVHYAVQKIAQNGATHFPGLTESDTVD